jgi:hypothetical protein
VWNVLERRTVGRGHQNERRRKMDIVTAITAGTRALEVLKALQDLNKSYDAATWKGKVAELMSDIADMKFALIEANDKIRDLKEDNEQLSAKIVFKAEKTKYENGLRYEIYEDGTIAEFPFCQNCETNGKFIRITRALGNIASCPGCKATYDMRSVMRR